MAPRERRSVSRSSSSASDAARAAQEAERRGDDADEEGGVLGGALGAADLPVAVEQRLAPRVALHEQQGALDDVDAAGPIQVDTVTQRDGIADRRDDVGHAAGIDVALEGVELEVERQPDVDRLDVAGGLAQQLGRTGDATDGDRELAPQPQAMGALDRVVDTIDDRGLGPGQQVAGLAGHPGVELGAGGEPEPTGAVGGVGRQAGWPSPTCGRRAPARRCAPSSSPPRRARRRPRRPGRGWRARGATPAPASAREASMRGRGGRPAGRPGWPRSRWPPGSAGGGT